MASHVKRTFVDPQKTRPPEKFPSFSRPKIVGHFSLDENHDYYDDTRNCRFVWRDWKNSEIRFDLNEGYEQVVRKQEIDEKLNHLLIFIAKNRPKLFGNETQKSRIDFVCFRGLLRLLMCSPYERQASSAWIILATKFNGTIYLCERKTDDAVRRRMNETADQKRFCSFGYKFEQCLMTEDPSKRPNKKTPVIEAEQFCCMFETKLNDARILYGAEMDGIECEQKVDLEQIDFNRMRFVELKTKIQTQNEHQQRNFMRFKSLNWWSQSFLVGIEKILVGNRTRNGIVNSIEELRLDDLRRNCRDFWSPSVAMQFCSDFLSLVQHELEHENCPKSVYKFEYDPSSGQSIKLSVFKGENEFTFLPKWFIDNEMRFVE